ncbi:DUF4192 domain-containing protein [Streptomyces sp. NPDC014733]|uniref:DUF4192 domain-containing protein n=1 Tax=Streptomyces sp. NPDC014733 TaxID=3364885 RepID=UPI0036F8C45A
MSPDNTVQVNTLPNLAQILPYLLGHYPDDSITLHAPGPNFHDGPTMTYPLPEDPTQWHATSQKAARHFAAYAHDRGHDLGQGVIIYLCREPRSNETPWDTAALLAPVTDWLTTELTQQRATVHQTIGLVANRWWAYECHTDGCCEGEPLPSPDDPTSVAAQMARLGRTPGPRTRDIINEFRATTTDPDFLQDLRNAASRFNTASATGAELDATLTTTYAQIDTAINQFRAGTTTLNRTLTAQLIVGLQDDAAVDAGAAHTADDDLPHARQLWAYLARHSTAQPAREAVPALTLYAFAAWQQGDLIAARLALRDALTADPEYDLALGIHLCITDGENPHDLLSAIQDSHARRKTQTQHTTQVTSEYRPIADTTAHRHREALDAAVATDRITRAFTEHGQFLARCGTIDIINAALADFRAGRAHLMDEIAARIILGIQDRLTRDVAMSTGDESDLPAERQLWGYLARRCVPPHTDKAPHLLTLLAWVAWRQGDITTACHALSDALDIEPGNRLAEPLLNGLRDGFDPAMFLEILRDEEKQFQAERADLDNL